MQRPKSRRGGYRRGKRRELSPDSKWSGTQRKWLRAVEHRIKLLRNMKRGPALEGQKWRASMIAYHSRLLTDLIPLCPKGCEHVRDEIAKLLKIGVESEKPTT